MKTFILDAAHGSNVPGKFSPVLEPSKRIANCDASGRFREYLWSREIIKILELKCIKEDISVVKTVTEDTEPGLNTRVRRTNEYYRLYKGKTVFVSIHADAVGYGSTWEKANGFSIFTSRGATKSDGYATKIFQNMTEEFTGSGLKFRKDYSDGDPDWESNFTVLMCQGPAVLIESFFQTNLTDVMYAMTNEFKEKFTNSLVKSFKEINNI